MSGAYYNEHDPFAAAWLRALIKDGLIARGDVDERDMQQVPADDLKPYTQCHFFAGIGGWSRALRLAGWPDDRPVWTGSCPCQPFSGAGQRKGHADERHLWPAFYALIAQRRPAVVFGEQVAGTLGYEWLAGVRADLEDGGYAVGAADLCAAGVGAPHIRQRLWWVADAMRGRADARRQSPTAHHDARRARRGRDDQSRHGGDNGGLADAGCVGDWQRSEPRGNTGAAAASEREARQQRLWAEPGAGVGGDGGMADADGRLAGHGHLQSGGQHGQQPQDGGVGGLEHAPRDGWQQRRPESGGRGAAGGCGDHWSRAEWLQCSDGKARRVEPGIFPLASGVPNRVGTLRGAGNAIVPQVAAQFVGAWLDTSNAVS